MQVGPFTRYRCQTDVMTTGGAIATENGGSITLQFVNMYRNRSPRGSAIYTASGNVTGSFVDFYCKLKIRFSFLFHSSRSTIIRSKSC